MIPAYNEQGALCSFLGFPMSQNRNAVPFWSYMIEHYQPKLVIELGTGNGAFSCLLSIACENTGARFVTYDKCHASIQWRQAERFTQLNCDVFAIQDQLHAEIGAIGRVFVLCDNGNKISEFKMIAPMLKHGDIIAAHDYVKNETYWKCSEITPFDISSCVVDHSLTRIFEDEAGKAAWLTYIKDTKTSVSV